MRPENAKMKAWLREHGIDARPRFITEGSMRGNWIIYGPGQRWTKELIDLFSVLGFVGFDGQPLGPYSGNGGMFSIYVIPKYDPAKTFSDSIVPSTLTSEKVLPIVIHVSRRNPLKKTGSRAKFRHKRIVSPKRFDPRSFRTKKVGASRVIIGCPKEKYSPSTGKCKVGTRAQAILRPLKRNAKEKASIKIDGKIVGTTTGLYDRRIPKISIAYGAMRKYWDKLKPDYVDHIISITQGNKTEHFKSYRDGETLSLRKIKKGQHKAKNSCGMCNPRKKWYYGPSLTHRGKVLVFPSSRTPTEATHGRKVKYAVGPFKTSEEAGKKARYMEMSATGR
jgi:hypothetical protein